MSDQRKVAELKIAAFIAEHCAVRASDHLGLIVKKLDKTSEVLSDLKLHRTKCMGLIKNVMSPCFLEDLVVDIGDNYYSLIIDESTSIDTKKMMCLVVRYYSKKKQKIETTFYRLLELEGGDACTLVTAFENQLKIDALKIDKLIGIGIDGANVMAGQFHSFSSLLKNKQPELIVVKCVCHSLHLAAENAFACLPNHLDFIIKQCHSWFAHSTKRQMAYKNIYMLLSENNKAPLKIDMFSGTRWLARYSAIEKIVEQWDALKLHFEIATSKEQCFVTSKLSEMFLDKVNLLYFTFLCSHLKRIVLTNKTFQTEQKNPLLLLKDLNDLLYNYLKMLIPPVRLDKISKNDMSKFNFNDYTMSAQYIDFGYSFNAISQNIDNKEVVIVKNTCRDFLVKICSEIQKRIPDNIAVLETISFLSPEKATSQLKPNLTSIAKAFKNVCGNVDFAIQEWEMIHRNEWANLDDPIAFWTEVSHFKNAINEPVYGHISRLALAVLSLPFSNAAVERAFSIANIIKDKLRNRMSIETADAIMRVRFSLKFDCSQFVPTANMLNKFSSDQIYMRSQDNTEEDDVVLDAFGQI